MGHEVKKIVKDCVKFFYTLDFSGDGCRYDLLHSEEFLQELGTEYGISKFYAGRLFNPVYQIFREFFAARDPFPYNPFPYDSDNPECKVHYWRLKKRLPKREEKFVKMVWKEYEKYLLANLELARDGSS